MPKLRVAVVVLLAVCAGCTTEPAPTAVTPPASSAPASSPSTSSAPTPATPVKVPAVAPGELFRYVISHKDGTVMGEGTVRAAPRANQEYFVQAACQSADPRRTFSYEVTSGGKRIAAAGARPCDGVVALDSVGTLPGGATTQVKVTTDRAAVVVAYAVLGLAPEGR
ncbi:hypothetical protein AB0J83_27880 [Actinoplanes sp. NPDC049596]|uniref:hypothetical protein n=1 Tax=unclassified Actinoplanes TaxID=2626549 RepID=UPI003441512E